MNLPNLQGTFKRNQSFAILHERNNKMAYADIEMFMEKLKQLMYCNDIPVINNPSIVCKRPQFQLLYEELDSMIQILLNHEDQELHNFEKVRKLKKKFIAALEVAEDIIDIFLSAVYCRYNDYFTISDVFQPSLHLEVVMRSIDSIKIEFMSMNINNMKMDSTLITDRQQMQSAGAAAGASRNRYSVGSKKLVLMFMKQ